MKFDVYIRTSCSVFDIDAKNEKDAQIKALKMMLNEAKKKHSTNDAVQHLEINYTIDSDDYYQKARQEVA